MFSGRGGNGAGPWEAKVRIALTLKRFGGSRAKVLKNQWFLIGSEGPQRGPLEGHGRPSRANKKKEEKQRVPQRGPFAIRSIWIGKYRCSRKLRRSRRGKVRGRTRKCRPWQQKLKAAEGGARRPRGEPRSERSI